MKKRNLIILLTIFLIITTSVTLVLLFKSNFTIQLSNNTLNDDYLEIYSFTDKQKLYTNFTEINYKSDNIVLALEEAMKDDKVSLEDILSHKNKVEALNDGGTKVYYFKKGDFTNRDFIILKCNTLSGNENIYILEEFDVYNNSCSN